jgi:hypothetical protein
MSMRMALIAASLAGVVVFAACSEEEQPERARAITSQQQEEETPSEAPEESPEPAPGNIEDALLTINDMPVGWSTEQTPAPPTKDTAGTHFR